MRHGFLLIDKPQGPTSHDVVARVRRRLSERHIGHLGTLDPAATGLLVLAVGSKALKVIELFSALPKTYEAEVRLGAVSTTYDRDGVIEETPPPLGWRIPEGALLNAVIVDRFLGHIAQVPPVHSAMKIGGERAYRKARQGRSIELAARDVFIENCDVTEFAYPMLRLRVSCGSGTYIRSLAHDLGKVLGCGGYLAALRRMSVGPWSLDAALPLDRAAWGHVLPLRDVLADYPRIDLTQDEWQDVQCGRCIERGITEKTLGWVDDLPVALLEPRGEGIAHPRKVL